MADPARKLTYTHEEYLAQENASATKHELIHGEIFAMSGGTVEHGALAANVIGELRALVRDRGCRVLTSDVRIRVEATGMVTYPDASVACPPIQVDPQDRFAVLNPVLIVEVLSNSTEDYDRHDKLAHYRRIPSLRDYLLVSQNERRIEHYRRNDDGSWTFRDVFPPDTVKLSLGGEISASEVYLGWEPPVRAP
jgi:Uma2 family endonuclease